jgi:hypothetical protein
MPISTAETERDRPRTTDLRVTPERCSQWHVAPPRMNCSGPGTDQFSCTVSRFLEIFFGGPTGFDGFTS